MVQPILKRANVAIPPAFATTTKSKHEITCKFSQAHGKYVDDLEDLLFRDAHISKQGWEGKRKTKKEA